MRFKKSLHQPGARKSRAWHHHGSVTLTSVRAILHHTDHTLGKHFAPECTQCGGFQFLLILDLWGIRFHAVVIFGLGKNLLFKFVLGHCITTMFVNFWNILPMSKPPPQPRNVTVCLSRSWIGIFGLIPIRFHFLCWTWIFAAISDDFNLETFFMVLCK